MFVSFRLIQWEIIHLIFVTGKHTFSAEMQRMQYFRNIYIENDLTLFLKIYENKLAHP